MWLCQNICHSIYLQRPTLAFDKMHQVNFLHFDTRIVWHICMYSMYIFSWYVYICWKIQYVKYNVDWPIRNGGLWLFYVIEQITSMTPYFTSHLYISNVVLRRCRKIHWHFLTFPFLASKKFEQVTLTLTFGLLLKIFNISHHYGTKRRRIQYLLEDIFQSTIIFYLKILIVTFIYIWKYQQLAITIELSYLVVLKINV